MANKKIQANKFKPVPKKKTSSSRADFGSSIDIFLRFIMIVAFVSVLSLSSIFAYDYVTQSDYFNVNHIEVIGANRVSRQDIISLARISKQDNIFSVNKFIIEKQVASHPWIQSAAVKRKLNSTLVITIREEVPLAIVKIENLADIIINTSGKPFKEYNPKEDNIENLPVITGLELTNQENQYLFHGELFNSIMKILSINSFGSIKQIIGCERTGITIETNDIYNPKEENDESTIKIKLGFGDFEEKLRKAQKISVYMAKNYPDKSIGSMDLYNIEKIFIKTKDNITLHNNIEKGV
ncbi:MAG: FtsQ-type POTRA domain-containing protein [Desulfobacteraceae bacterium]|nr:FtsQ-type POTRA domain-containing protein [Desulfobacteraceae bacterium]